MTQQTTNETTERQMFEAWCRASGNFTDWSKFRGQDVFAGEYQKPMVRLAWQAWRAARAALPPTSEEAVKQTAVERMLETNQLDELGREVARLQTALCFWLPSVTDREDDVADRILQDAFLLCGIDGNISDDFKTAQDLGWVTLSAPAAPVADTGAVPCSRLALNVRHQDAHKAADAFWLYWKENGETHKHGYYESTWGAINRAIRMVGVVEHDYWPDPQTYPKKDN